MSYELNDIRAIRIGNIYGPKKGTSFAGNVWHPDYIAPTLNCAEGGNRMPLIICE